MTTRKRTASPAGLPQLLTERQVSEFTGIPRSTLAKARCEGVTGRRAAMPPFVKQGGRVRYPLRDLLDWLDGLERRAHI
jgi:predicted DNA-binding transcriptional regulator AlpA